MSIFRIGVFLLLAATVIGPALADEVDELARQLIALRSEVEELNQELDLIKDEHRADMGSLAAQKTELSANRNRLDTQLQQLQQKLAENVAIASQAGVDNEALFPAIIGAMDEMRSHIESTLPFKREERLSELDEIRVQLETNVIPANRAANRLWGYYEDEIRLTRENGVYSQTIELNGERLLAEVAKLGTVLLYFRTSDERYGQVRKSGEDWRFELVDDPDSIASIEVLFDSLQKQIRQGYFEIPNTLAGRVSS